MKKVLPSWFWVLVLSLFSLGFGLVAPTWFDSPSDTDNSAQEQVIIVAQQATESPSVTPTIGIEPSMTNTLRPAPTLEPPTATPFPSMTPTLTPTLSIFVNATVQGIRGLPSPTPENTLEVCTPREDWTLRYTVQFNETLSSIASKFSTDIWTLADANCLEDMNRIQEGQALRVPGENLPVEPAVVCEPYQVLQPIDHAWNVPATGQITFNWTGTKAPRNLIRLYPPDYDFSTHNPDEYIDIAFDLRQNETVNLMDLPDEGTWHWQVYPLDMNFMQVCPESPLWTFTKNGLD